MNRPSSLVADAFSWVGVSDEPPVHHYPEPACGLWSTTTWPPCASRLVLTTRSFWQADAAGRRRLSRLVV